MDKKRSLVSAVQVCLFSLVVVWGVVCQPECWEGSAFVSGLRYWTRGVHTDSSYYYSVPETPIQPCHGILECMDTICHSLMNYPNVTLVSVTPRDGLECSQTRAHKILLPIQMFQLCFGQASLFMAILYLFVNKTNILFELAHYCLFLSLSMQVLDRGIQASVPQGCILVAALYDFCCTRYRLLDQ